MQSSLPRVLKFTLAYDGTRFAGWQRQDGLRTVQGVLEEALAAIEGCPVAVAGAGRTDAGVHAAGQVASATVAETHTPDIYGRALNATLPDDVRVVAVEEAAPAFHARFTPSTKTYRYTIWNGPVAPALVRHLVWHVPHQLDLAAMREAGAGVTGTHDFGAFCAKGSAVRTFVRTVTRLEVSETPVAAGWPLDARQRAGGSSVRLVCLDVEGPGFLRQMVRTLAGTLVEIGKGRWPPAHVRQLIASGDRAAAGPTAPAAGLALIEVRHEDAVEVHT